MLLAIFSNIRINWISKVIVPFYYLRLYYLGVETVACCLFLRIGLKREKTLPFFSSVHVMTTQITAKKILPLEPLSDIFLVSVQEHYA